MKARRVAPILLLAWLLLVGLPAAAPAQEPGGTGTGDPALEDLAACVGDRGHLLVMLLMDESGSLRGTDPNNERVPAAKAALANLQTLAGIEFDTGTPMVEIAIAAFATNYTLVAEWTTLDEQTAGGLRGQLDTFAERSTGFDTDYQVAMGGAREDIARRSSQVTAEEADTPCKALMLFTDGDYDIELRRSADQISRHGLHQPYAEDLPLNQPGNPERVVERGKSLICDADGLRDQLADDDITLVTIAFSDEISEAETRWLEAVTRGSAPDEQCGTRVTSASGAFVRVEDLAALLAAFNRVTNEMAGGALAPGDEQVPVCPLASCPEGTREFEIDETLSRFHLLADLGADEVRVELRSPGADEALEIPAEGTGAVILGSAELRYEWLSRRALTVDAVLPRDTRDWVGTWSVTFIDPTGTHPDAVANSHIYLYGDLSPQLVKIPPLRLGETTEFVVEIVDSAGGGLTPAAVEGAVQLHATMTDPTAEAEEAVALAGPDDAGQFTGTYAVRDDLAASFLVLRLRAVVTTAAGVELAPFARTYQLPISPPLVFPHIEPAELRLSSITGIGTAVGTLRVVGGEGRGCVWIDEVRLLQVPEGAGELRVENRPAPTGADSCLSVSQGETHEIDFSVSNTNLASGRATGLVGVSLAVEGEDRVIRQEVPLRFDMARPVRQFIRWLLVLLFLIGLLIPVALQYLLNWRSARFEPTHELLFSRTPVVIRGNDHIERIGGNISDGRYHPEIEDYSNVGGSAASVRDLAIGNVAFQARVAPSPWQPPYGEATVEGASVTGPDGHRERDGSLRGRVPLGLAGSWVFVLDDEATFQDVPTGEDEPEPTDIHGTLLSVLTYAAGGAFTQQVDRVLSRLDSDLPPAARSLARETARQRPPPTDDEAGEDERPQYETTAGGSFPTPDSPFPERSPTPGRDDPAPEPWPSPPTTRPPDY